MAHKPNKYTMLLTAGLILAGITVNRGGSLLAAALGTSMFFDSLGTILAAALAGYLPGIIVGFATNAINGLSDYTSFYYSSLNILIAVAAAYFAQRKILRRFPHMLIAILSFAAIGGVLGSILTYFLAGGTEPDFLGQLSRDVIIDLEDKTITVVLAAVILRLLPQRVFDVFNLMGWRDEVAGERKEGEIRGTMNTRVGLLISAATITVALVVSGISISDYHNALIEEQSTFADNLAALAATYIDPDAVSDYIERGYEAEGYAETEERLNDLWNSVENVEYLYAYRILPDGCHVVFDVDTPDTPGGEPGELVPFDESFAEFIPTLLAGGRIKPMVTNDTYGWLLTAYEPVYDAQGRCQCYVAVDLLMSRLVTDERIFTAQLISLFMGFYILILTIGIYISKYRLIRPINELAATARAFAFNSEEARDDTVANIRQLNIHTGDEIENLYRALIKTAENTARYIKDSQEKSNAIAKLQNGLIIVMADLVESRDKCTGDHVKNTAAYVRIIMERMKREGIYADQLTDQYIEDVVNSAPLHDIGKIKVPDGILNKPGRLDNEEFTQMKLHASQGGQIIAEAIEKLDGDNSGYLREAQNLAMSHHEKWNGSGYPRGLKGEEIPLSARVMAVADVFDALVSKRSYKEGMPFDKAMNIIKEGSGSHFDPRIVQAFVDSEEEVRAYLENERLGAESVPGEAGKTNR